jgi:hypothetical protein
VPTSPEQLAVNTIKGLAMDAVERAKSGHPGMPMGMAELEVGRAPREEAARLWAVRPPRCLSVLETSVKASRSTTT